MDLVPDDDSDTICFVDFDTGEVTLPLTPYRPRLAPFEPLDEPEPEPA